MRGAIENTGVCASVLNGYALAGYANKTPDQGPHTADMRPRILLIEDEAAIADTLVFALESNGYEVEWKNLGGEGEAWLAAHPVDLVLLDIGLPDDNGFDICPRVRQQYAVPVIFLTARKEEVDRIVGLEIGADDYVTKPFSPRELVARVRAVLRRSQGSVAPTAPQPQSRFTLDDAGKRIAYHGQWLDLTRYEYRILHILCGRPGQVFSREQLLERAWDDPTSAFDRAVDTHIKTLRAKLRDVNAEDVIRTHRGMGYSLLAESSSA